MGRVISAGARHGSVVVCLGDLRRVSDVDLSRLRADGTGPGSRIEYRQGHGTVGATIVATIRGSTTQPAVRLSGKSRLRSTAGPEK